MAVHGKHTRILIDKYNLTRIFNEYTSTGAKDEADVTAFGTDEREYEPGFRDSRISFSGNFDTQLIVDGADLRADQVLNDAFDEDTSSRLVAVGQNGLNFAKRVRLFEGSSLSYDQTAPVGDKVGVAASFAGRKPNRLGFSLADFIARNTGANGADLDAGAGGATTEGAFAQLHVPVNTRNGALAVKVQHSADGVSWVDLLTFDNVVSSTLAAQRKVIEDVQVERHVRAVWTIGGTGGDVTFFVGFARL